MAAGLDVVVVGAGPAGAVCACLLARAGCSVALVDPRLGDDAAPPKPGEALPGAASRLLRAAGLRLPGESGAHRPIGGNISVWGGPEPVFRDFFTEPDGPGWRLDRAVFEAEIVGAAAAAGVRLCPQAARGFAREGTTWHVTVQGGEALDARWLVDASGRASRVGRTLGAQRHRDEELLAVVARGLPDPAFTLSRTLVETTPEGWWYAALLPDGTPILMLHTTPEDAGRFIADRAAWQASFEATRQVSAAFPGLTLDAPPRGFEAGGAWLDPAMGDGWVACGDAALSFDPASAQGLFSALHGAVEAAVAVKEALRGDLAGIQAYAARLVAIRQIYRQRVLTHYAEERRWPEAAFWRARRGG